MRGARISEIGRLETQKSELSGQLEVLNGKITTLEGKIADTERRLAASEGDKEFLQRELRRMQAEKVALEQRFQDLAQLREQVQVLKEEMGIARRLDVIRRGGSLFDRKGAQLLQEGIPRPPESGSVRGDLNVEVTPVTTELGDGRVFTERVAHPRGSPHRLFMRSVPTCRPLSARSLKR